MRKSRRIQNRSPKFIQAEPDTFRVALITMPFFPISNPSIQIGLLHSITERAGFPVDSYHLNLQMAASLPEGFYKVFSNNAGGFTADWFFSRAAFGKSATPMQDFFGAFPEERELFRRSRLSLRRLKKMHSELVPRFLDECMQTTDWGKYRVIGFSSTFQQNVPSLALAKRMKEKFPHVKIVFGGANMEGEMGLEHLRAFPFIDYVATGEGDFVFPALLQRLSRSDSVEDLTGLAFRWNNDVRVNGTAPPIQDMDSLPVPNYDDYFDRCKKLKVPLSLLETYLPIEAARGCWWGEKHHCTFCGINGLNMKFRAKSIERVLDELSEQSEKYGFVRFRATDNILDLKYLKELFVQTQQIGRNYRFFWEIKANLTRDQIRTLYLGGIRELQPGIESLSTHVLQLMRKGCTMLQNLVTMKWCRFYGIHILWNLLYGFPGELEEDYRRELDILKLISHLEPPFICTQIQLERFAPYFFDRDKFPVTGVQPQAGYAYIYPPNVNLEKLAYFFDYEMGDTVSERIHDETKEWIFRWKQKWETKQADVLIFHCKKGKLFIKDQRTLLNGNDHRLGTYKFAEPAASVYPFCSDRYRTIREILDELRKKGQDGCKEEGVQGILDSFCKSGFMVSDEGKYLALALPAPFPYPRIFSLSSF